MTHRDRAGDPSGHGAGRREAAGDVGHRQGFPTPAHSPAAGSPARPERRLPQVLWAKAFGRPNACGRGAWLAMPRIAAPHAPGRKPWETVSMSQYQGPLVLNALPVDSEIVVSIGTPKHDRRLSDKILAAFSHAYGEGALAVAALLRRALEEAERESDGALPERRAGDALTQAELWVEFVEARDAFRRVFEAEAPGPGTLEDARAEMLEAYKAWSCG